MDHGDSRSYADVQPASENAFSGFDPYGALNAGGTFEDRRDSDGYMDVSNAMPVESFEMKECDV